jgi:hypothetical protein
MENELKAREQNGRKPYERLEEAKFEENNNSSSNTNNSRIPVEKQDNPLQGIVKLVYF